MYIVFSSINILTLRCAMVYNQKVYDAALRLYWYRMTLRCAWVVNILKNWFFIFFNIFNTTSFWIQYQITLYNFNRNVYDAALRLDYYRMTLRCAWVVITSKNRFSHFFQFSTHPFISPHNSLFILIHYYNQYYNICIISVDFFPSLECRYWYQINSKLYIFFRSTFFDKENF